MEIDSLCFHNIADFPPSAHLDKLGRDKPFFWTILYIEIYIGSYTRDFVHRIVILVFQNLALKLYFMVEVRKLPIDVGGRWGRLAEKLSLNIASL